MLRHCTKRLSSISMHRNTLERIIYPTTNWLCIAYVIRSYKTIAELLEFMPQNEKKKKLFEMFVWKRENLSLTIIMETNGFGYFLKRKVLSTKHMWKYRKCHCVALCVVCCCAYFCIKICWFLLNVNHVFGLFLFFHSFRFAVRAAYVYSPKVCVRPMCIGFLLNVCAVHFGCAKMICKTTTKNEETRKDCAVLEINDAKDGHETLNVSSTHAFEYALGVWCAKANVNNIKQLNVPFIVIQLVLVSRLFMISMLNFSFVFFSFLHKNR